MRIRRCPRGGDDVKAALGWAIPLNAASRSHPAFGLKTPHLEMKRGTGGEGTFRSGYYEGDETVMTSGFPREPAPVSEAHKASRTPVARTQ